MSIDNKWYDREWFAGLAAMCGLAAIVFLFGTGLYLLVKVIERLVG